MSVEPLRAACCYIFGESLAEKLLSVYAAGTDTVKVYVFGCVVLIASSSLRCKQLPCTVRLSSLVANFAEDLASSLAAYGFFDEIGCSQRRQQQQQQQQQQLRCFHCNTLVALDAAVTLASSLSQHRSASPKCYLGRLLQLPLAAEAPENLAVDAGRYSRALGKLRTELDSRCVQLAESFGLPPVLLRLCATRHFMEKSGTLPPRAGDLIRIAYQFELLLPWRVFDVAQLIDRCLPQQLRHRLRQQQQSTPSSSASVSASVQAEATRSATTVVAPATQSATAAMVGADDTGGAELEQRCFLCRRRQRNRALLPCAHFLLCDACLQLRAPCPVCGQLVLGFTNVYTT